MAGTLSTKVLIVGAGPAGLSLAIELGQRGIACLVIEKNDRVGYAPRAKTTNVRTREHLRRWGIAKDLAAAAPFGIDYPSDVVFATRLNGYLLARFENASYCAPGRNELYSEHGQWIPQYTLEEVLRRHAERLPGVEIRFRCRLEHATQSPQGVSAVFVDLASGERRQVACEYLAGADGARSTVRDLIGAKMEGSGVINRHYNMIVRAPGLSAKHPHGPAIMYWLVNEDVPSVIAPMDRDEKWAFGCSKLGEEGVDPQDLIRRATGIAQDIEVLSTDEWAAQRLMATHYREGRIFLAGDACHLHPPFGGYGMNMGIGDAVDLGWKIAAVLQGWGGEALLASYERERRPVHIRVMDEAVANHAILGAQLYRPGIEDAGEDGERIRRDVGQAILSAKLREFKTLGVVIGYRYTDSPVIVSDGSDPPEERVNDYVPSAHPGCRAPHTWLAEGTGPGASLFDHFGAGLTLLVTEAGEDPQIERMSKLAAATGVPLKVLAPESRRVAELYQARYALIRPDQHVAWRGNRIPADASQLLGRVCGQ